MGLITNMFQNKSGSSLSNPAKWLVEMFGGQETASGTQVNEHTANHYSAYYACVRIISETVALLPLPLYRRIPTGGKERAPNHPLYTVLHDVSNSEMTSFTLRETLQGHLCTWGNCYAEIEYNGAGQVIGLWPLRPDMTWPERDPTTRRIVYKTVIDDEQITLPFERVFHIPGFGFDGLRGYSPVQLFRENIGMGLATEEYGARFFGNGAKPGGVLEHPSKLKDEAKDYLRKSWNEMHQGLSRQHRIAVLEEGMTYKQIGIPPEDAQFLDTRKFQRNEMAMIFRVPPHMLADLDRATFNNIENMDIGFVKHTMLPWLKRWEQTISMRLLTPMSRKSFFAEFLVEGLLRGDIKSRYEAYQIAIQNGVMNADEWRELENMNPQPDGQGQVYFINSASLPKQRLIDGEGGEGGSGT